MLLGCVLIKSHLILRYLCLATQIRELEMFNGDSDAALYSSRGVDGC